MCFAAVGNRGYGVCKYHLTQCGSVFVERPLTPPAPAIFRNLFHGLGMGGEGSIQK